MNRVFLLLPIAALGGCVTLLPPPPPPPRLFVLEAGEVAPRAEAHVDAVAAVAAPTGERALLGTDLAWRNGDELAFVANSQWSARAEAALQSLLIETLVRQGRFNAVTRAGEGRSDYELRWEVLDFQVVEARMQARLVANVQVLAMPGRRVIAQEIIVGEAPVSDRSESVVAEALARAARDGSAHIGVFAANAASAHAATE
jgi:ABC-type uncharacterized transport system auxiliary subunit